MGSLYAQLTGIWSSFQAQVPLTSRFHLQPQVQPRFIPVFPPQRMDMLVAHLFLWYRVRGQGFSVEGNRAWIWYPRRATQWRLRTHWQWRPHRTLSLRLTLEQRWEGPQVIERMVRPLATYTVPVGQGFQVGLRQEGLFYGWNPRKGWHVGVRQNRSWIFLGYGKGPWRTEVGYLLLAAPQRLPRHNFWLAVVWEGFSRPRPPENGKADPATSAQTPLPESPAESPAP